MGQAPTFPRLFKFMASYNAYTYPGPARLSSIQEQAMQNLFKALDNVIKDTTASVNARIEHGRAIQAASAKDITSIWDRYAIQDKNIRLSLASSNKDFKQQLQVALSVISEPKHVENAIVAWLNSDKDKLPERDFARLTDDVKYEVFSASKKIQAQTVDKPSYMLTPETFGITAEQYNDYEQDRAAIMADAKQKLCQQLGAPYTGLKSNKDIVFNQDNNYAFIATRDVHLSKQAQDAIEHMFMTGEPLDARTLPFTVTLPNNVKFIKPVKEPYPWVGHEIKRVLGEIALTAPLRHALEELGNPLCKYISMQSDIKVGAIPFEKMDERKNDWDNVQFAIKEHLKYCADTYLASNIDELPAFEELVTNIGNCSAAWAGTKEDLIKNVKVFAQSIYQKQQESEHTQDEQIH